jgi:DNA repair protein RecN (Recombination protein N)
MLQKLSISNYALIQEINIDLRAGLTIITGETGAGKSILLGALHLLMGDKADSNVVNDSSKKCIIEAVWNIQHYDLKDFFIGNDLDYDITCIIRREMSIGNKSRAFINDTPVNLQQLKELSNRLIDIHSQHDTLLIHNQQFQLQLLDAPANNFNLLKQFNSVFNSWKKNQKQRISLEIHEQKLNEETDFFKFQLAELEQADLKENELQELENEVDILSNIEEIQNNYEGSVLIIEQDNGILQQLKKLQYLLLNVAKFDASNTDITLRLDALYIEIKDILNELKFKNSKIESNPQKLEMLNERLDILNHLLNKHRFSQFEDLFNLKNSIKLKLNESSNISEEIIELKKRENELLNEVQILGQNLREKRKSVIPELETKSVLLLRRLGISDAKVKLELIEKDQFDATGKDLVKIYFSANKGSDLKEITKVGSGGELSRFMLSLKKIIAGSVALPTIVFDEIDTGISGAVADSMGEVLKEMGKEIQVIAITHLPQIASKGDDHLKVYKSTKNETTITTIFRLSADERVDEIATMLSGKALSQAAIINAKSLLGEQIS